MYDVQVNAEPGESYSEIVVKGEGQVGFLHFFSGILADLGLNIEMCKCSGFGGQVANRFYLTPIASPETIRQQIIAYLKRGFGVAENSAKSDFRTRTEIAS